MPTVRVNGADLYYEEYGDRDEVVLSSAMRFDPATYPVLLSKEPANYRVYTIQARGYGRSSHVTEAPAAGWLNQWADDVRGFAQALGIERFLYTGVSHGGGIGWHLAERYPEMVKALISVVGTPHDRAGGVESSEQRRKLIEGRHDPAAVEEQLRVLDGPTDDPERQAERDARMPERVRRVMRQPADEAAINQGKPFPESKSDEELAQRLRTIAVPVLILAAMRDGVISPQSTLRAATNVPGAKAVLFEDEGHSISAESPHRLIREVRLFVDELNGTAQPVGRR